MAQEKSKVPVATLEYEPTGFEQTLLKHKSKLILVGVLAVAGTLGYWGWRLYKESAHNSAAYAFTRATTAEELKKVADAHAGQTGAGSALILAAEKLSADGKSAEAIKTLKDFLSGNPEHPLRDLASWRVAEYAAATGDTATAATEYEAVAQADTPFSGLALLRLGDMKWGAGEKEKAQEYYEKIKRMPSMAGNPARTEADERIETSLKMKPPTLVEYEPPLLPPPNLKGGGPTPGGPSFNSAPTQGSFNLPPNFPRDPEPPFSPRPPDNRSINAPSLLDETPSVVPVPPPSVTPVPPPATPGENPGSPAAPKPGTDTPVPPKPSTGSQP